MRPATAALLVVPLVLLAACGDGDPVATGSSSTTRSTSPADGGPSSPTAPAGSEAVVRIDLGGGFVPFGTDFAAVPRLVLADGTVFTGGAITLQYPGPAVLPVLTGRLTEAQVDDLLQAAAAAHLDEERDFGEPGVSDLPSTTITVVLDGEAHTTSIAGLEGADVEGGLTEAQRQARAEVRRFLTTVTEVLTPVATEPHAPSAYQVLALPTQPAAAAGGEPLPDELDWPAGAPPLAEGGCIDVGGADAEALSAALAEATSITVWRSGGAHWQLAVRATLPGDEACGTGG